MAAPMARYLLICIVVLIQQDFELIFAAKITEDSSCQRPECVQVDLPPSQMQIDVTERPNGDTKLCVLCFSGVNRKWYRLWLYPRMRIHMSDLDSTYDVYYGRNVTEVIKESESSSYLRLPSVWGQLRHEYGFEPFNSSCIGVMARSKYRIDFDMKNPEIWFVFYSGLGLLLFFFAPSWSRNTFLHYGTGMSVGVLGSVLIGLFIINKFLPQKVKTLGSVLMVVSSSASMFLLQHISLYLNEIFLNYWQYVLGYVAVASLISFVVIYRYGPVSNPRTLDLVRWSLQALGLALIFWGSQIPEMSVVIMASALLVYFFPRGLMPWLRRMRMRYFPPRLRLLTEEEFYREGQVETERALKELREFCRSPECDAWKTVSRLNLSNRFGRFMEGEEHVTEDESLIHDSTCEINPLDLDGDTSSESELSFRLNTR